MLVNCYSRGRHSILHLLVAVPHTTLDRDIRHQQGRSHHVEWSVDGVHLYPDDLRIRYFLLRVYDDQSDPLQHHVE